MLSIFSFSWHICCCKEAFQFVMPLLDGRVLCIYTDIDKTCESIARFSKSDAENYREFSHKLAGFMNAFLGPATYAPPFGDMVKGSIKQGAYHPLQMGFMRPNDECSHNRTPINSLYLCGSCCYPGGLIIFGSRYLAANAVADDLGLEKWWSDPEYLPEYRKTYM